MTDPEVQEFINILQEDPTMTDDEKYWALMSKYKEERLTKDEEANKWLRAAMKMEKDGRVSDDAALGGGYM
jgi:hypothetical protein